MDLTQFAILLITFTGLFIWNRTESRNDARRMDSKIESFRAETGLLIKAIEANIMAIHQEIKDFHGRLCTIEEKNRKQ